MYSLPPLSLYIHIPWCIRKCYYCDFNSYKLKNKILQDQYVDLLLNDLEQDILLTSNRTVETIFIGGGTPSLFSIDSINNLLDGIRSRLSLSDNLEINMESNPNTIESDRFIGYKQAGITRISIGVQSFQPKNLISIGRTHNSQEAINASKLVSKLNLKSFNIDIMYGLPNQTLKQAIDDLHKAISLFSPHISWYQLSIEPNTLFSSRQPILPSDDVLWKIYSKGNNLLALSGYQQYEFSSYSLTDHKCQHNVNYWRFGDYLGIGCGAYSKLTQINGDLIRTVKSSNPSHYMTKKFINKRYIVKQTDLPLEYFMNRFQLLEPIPRREFTLYTGLSEKKIRLSLNQAIDKNYITENNSYWMITEKGKLFLDSLLEFFA